MILSLRRSKTFIFLNGKFILLYNFAERHLAESVEPERDWLLACPEIVRDNPEVERAVHERLWAISLSLAEAVARRLGAAPDEPRIRAVVALAMAIQRTAINCGAVASCPFCGIACGAGDATIWQMKKNPF